MLANPEVDESSFMAALLLEALASTGDSQFARFWSRYKELLPPADQFTHLILFDRSQLGWLQVR